MLTFTSCIRISRYPTYVQKTFPHVSCSCSRLTHSRSTIQRASHPNCYYFWCSWRSVCRSLRSSVSSLKEVYTQRATVVKGSPGVDRRELHRTSILIRAQRKGLNANPSTKAVVKKGQTAMIAVMGTLVQMRTKTTRMLAMAEYYAHWNPRKERIRGVESMELIGVRWDVQHFRHYGSRCKFPYFILFHL